MTPKELDKKLNSLPATEKGHLTANLDIACIKFRHEVGTLDLPEGIFHDEKQRAFFQELINTYRREISVLIEDTSRLENQREICRTNNEKRKINIPALTPEIGKFIQGHRRDNPGANINEILDAISEHLETEKGIRVSVRTLRKYDVQGMIRSIAEKEKSKKK